MNRALELEDETTLTKGFEYLKSHYKFIGILTVIGVSLYLIFFIIGIASAISAI